MQVILTGDFYHIFSKQAVATSEYGLSLLVVEDQDVNDETQTVHLVKWGD